MIRRLLVANRGEVARRVLATCRAVGIETVAVYADADAGAAHVTEADYAIHLPGTQSAATYLRGDLLVAAARRCGADAVHPGYGFLAEDADFATAVLDAGLTWVGPTPKAIEVMASRIDAKALVTDAGVPALPIYAEPEDVDSFPVIVKASAGRGGRAMRVVRDREGLAEAVASARREAAAAFGDGTVFAERYVESARHIEVQIIADSLGNVATLGERECSIQRRYQEILTETPSLAVTPSLREALCGAAIEAARAIGYVGAGTVEFILSPSGEFHFQQMSTRLALGHAVTECVMSVDLVALQLLVAEGGSLPFTGALSMRGHAIEVRLNAEDPAYAWLPSAGTLHRFTIPGVAHGFSPLAAPGLRLDAAVSTGDVVEMHYDPLLAKLTAWAPTRPEAARLLSTALARAQIHGVTTNRDLLVRVLRHPAFQTGTIDTAFLDRHPEVFAPLLSSVDAVRLSCLAAALAGAAQRRSGTGAFGSLPSGWRNVPSCMQTVAYEGQTGTVEVGYRLDRRGDLVAWSVREVDPDDVGLPGSALEGAVDPNRPVAVVSASPSRVELDVAGVRLGFDVHQVQLDGELVAYVDSAEGSVTLTELPRYPVPAPAAPEGSLVAPLPGLVARVLVAPGRRVSAGDLVLTVEAMRSEHPVHAQADGVISDLRVMAGVSVDAGTLLAVVSPE
jgi:propionyl-CoA carboxylase alpha chain